MEPWLHYMQETKLHSYSFVYVMLDCLTCSKQSNLCVNSVYICYQHTKQIFTSSKYLSPCSSVETFGQNGFSSIYSGWLNYMKRAFNHNTDVCYISNFGSIIFIVHGVTLTIAFPCLFKLYNIIFVSQYNVVERVG